MANIHRLPTEPGPARARADLPRGDRAPLRFVVVGHVDHGKSTLMGRLLHEAGALPDGKFEAIQAMSQRRGMPFEWAFVLDALQAERDQGVTIDSTQFPFRAGGRGYVIIDAPGHKEFLRNMITGAASADAAILVVDAKEGVREQTRRHGYLISLLGLRQVVVAVNKMDLVGWSEERFAAVSREVRAYLAELGLAQETVPVVPIAARDGDNLMRPGPAGGWYGGPTLIEALDAFQPPAPPVTLPLRLPIQDVYKFDDRRILAGRIEAGRLHVGDEVLFSPSGKRARVVSIEAWNTDGPVIAAGAGQSIGITLDEPVFVERGEIVSHDVAAPMLTPVLRGKLFWLGRHPLREGASYTLKLATNRVTVQAERIEKVIRVDDLSTATAETVERNGMAEVIFRTKGMLALDPHATCPRTGRFVLLDGHETVGGGLISMEGYADLRAQLTVRSTNIHKEEHRLPVAERWARNGHKSGVIWLTGLSGAGKSTLAFRLEEHLLRKGLQAFVLDGDNIRHGLAADLGFSPEDRAENIRRVGEVAKLFAEAGIIAITAFISPYRGDRDRVRALAPDMFHEVHVKADLAVCEARDVKGLYRKARAGEIWEFTGISAPYEPPLTPELTIDTAVENVDDSLERLAAYVLRVFA